MLRGSTEAPRRASSPPRALGDSAHRLRQSGTEHVHTCASFDANVTLSSIPSRIGPRISTLGARAAPLDVEPRGAASPTSLVESIQGIWLRTPRCSHGARSSGPAVRDRERRPGGHRARHGRLGDTADRLSGSGTDHVHTVALDVSNVTLALAGLEFERLQIPPEGRRTLECRCVDNSVPAWRSWRELCIDGGHGGLDARLGAAS